MKSGASLLAGAGVGVSLAYFLDPARGARRRARLRDTMTHSASMWSHWKVAGPAATTVDFDAEITGAVPNQRWRGRR